MNTKITGFLAIGLFGILLFSTSAQAQTDKCSKVNGTYQRSHDKLVMTLRQNGCEITGDVPPGAYNHTIEGLWSSADNGFDVKILRTSKGDGCVTKMTGFLYKWRNNIRLVIDGTDGRCDIPADYRENSIWAAR
jgi:hypothetical protein